MSAPEPTLFAWVDEYRNLIVNGHYLGSGPLAGKDAEFLNAAVQRERQAAKAGALREAADQVEIDAPALPNAEAIVTAMSVARWLRSRAERAEKETT